MNQIGSYAGVGFTKDPIANIYGTYNGFVDNKPADYKVQVNWGDGPSWDANTSVVADGNDILVKGTHIYQQQGTYAVVVYVTGPDGQTVSGQSVFVSVAPTSDSATLTAPDITDANATAQNSYILRVVYQSSNGEISGSSVPGGQVNVVGPNGDSIAASLLSQTPSGDSSTITAYYSATPPSGSWAMVPQGTYTVKLAARPSRTSTAARSPRATWGPSRSP